MRSGHELGAFDAFFAVARDHHAIAPRLKEGGGDLEVDGRVVDDQDRRIARRNTGNVHLFQSPSFRLQSTRWRSGENRAR
jgi:hypothetical protein